jgi:hypothetical protein
VNQPKVIVAHISLALEYRRPQQPLSSIGNGGGGGAERDDDDDEDEDAIKGVRSSDDAILWQMINDDDYSTVVRFLGR